MKTSYMSKREEEILSYRNGTTLEHKIELNWYTGDPYSIMFWNPTDAQGEFNKEYYKEAGRYFSRTKWLKKVRLTEKLIKEHLAEAALSKSEYVREYARLIMNKQMEAK